MDYDYESIGKAEIISQTAQDITLHAMPHGGVLPTGAKAKIQELAGKILGIADTLPDVDTDGGQL